MSEDTRWSPSRRRFVKYGAVSAGTLLGSTGASAATGSESETADSETLDHGLMLPYQFTPESRATVVESGLDWQPKRFENRYRTSVIAYDHAPSYRAFLFTEPDATIESDRSLRFGSIQRSPAAAGRRVVTVGLE